LYKYKAQQVIIYSTKYDNFEGSPSKRVIFFTCYFYQEGDKYEPFYLVPRFFFLVNDTPYFQQLSVTAAGVGEEGLDRLKKEKEQTLDMNFRISHRLVEYISIYDKSGELEHEIAIEPHYYYYYQDKFKYHMTLLLSIKEEILRTLILGW
jgi:hypothetical protein